MPIVGFLPAGDERVRSTVAAIEHKLTQDGLVMRYEEDSGSAFLPCSFWMVAVLILLNRRNDAIDLLEKLRSLSNDAGLLAEEYDLRNKRLMGNFPQAFTHVSLVNAIHMLNGAGRDVRIKVAVCRPACAHTPNIAQPPCWRSGRRTVNTAAPFGYAEPEPPPPTMRDHRQSGERPSGGRDRCPIGSLSALSVSAMGPTVSVLEMTTMPISAKVACQAVPDRTPANRPPE